MNKIKSMVATAGATAALAFGLVGTAGATGSGTANVCGNIGSGSVNCENNDNDDNSRHFSGNCNVFSYVGVDQNNASAQTGVGTGGAGTGAVGNGTGGDGSVDQSNNTNQNVTVNNSPDCSVHNVTNVTQAAAQTGGRGAGEAEAVAAQTGGRGAGEAQVSAAPRGGVGAGAGGAAQSSAAAVAGLSSSLGVLGLGLRLRKGFQL